MKRLGLLITTAAMTASVSTQTVTESKTFDSFYVSISGGIATKTTGNSWMRNLDPNTSLRIDRNFTPVFSTTAESNAYFSNKPLASTGTAIRALNTSLLGAVSLSGWFNGCTGEPRSFKLVGLYGFGWGHLFGNTDIYKKMNHGNLISKVAVNFVFSLGAEKAWQFCVESATVWALNGDGTRPIECNINRSAVRLNADFVYEFKSSNGADNFAIAQLHDQAEIDGLSAQINSLRSDLNDKNAQLSNRNRQISDLQKALEECKNKEPIYVKPATATNPQPTVLFHVSQSVVGHSQMSNAEIVAKYMKDHKDSKITIKGYVSPEGPAELNQRLSESRVKNVKNLLVGKYKITPSHLTIVGMGVTDKLFGEYSFDRVATFNDDTSVE